MKKKHFYLIFMLLQALFLGTYFLPLYQINVVEGGKTKGYKTVFYESFNAQGESLIRIACYLFFIVVIASILFGLALSIIALIAKPDDGDREDKFFVFSCFVLALSHAFMSMMQLGTQSFMVMLLALGYSILTAASIFIHHRFLTDY